MSENAEQMTLTNTLNTLQFLRNAKSCNDDQIHSALDIAFAECGRNGVTDMLLRIIFHMGDISRRHNIFKELEIDSDNGGAQERKIFRSCVRWMIKNTPNFVYSNLELISEFTSYQTLMYYKLTTDRYIDRGVSVEKLFIDNDYLFPFLQDRVRLGKNLNLIAKHLPKYSTGGQRKQSKKLVGLRGNQDKPFNWTVPTKSWVKLNGELITAKPGEKILVNPGDVVEYPRSKRSESMDRQNFLNTWITKFCVFMDWTLSEYKEFRKLQNTAEQKMSSKKVSQMTQDEFNTFLDGLTGGQRKRVVHSLNNDKWGVLCDWYKSWEKEQTELAVKIRNANSPEEKKDLMKEFKVKTTGDQTIDILADMLSGRLSREQVDNNYLSLIERMNISHSVFPIIDGSGSMNSSFEHNGVVLTNRQVAYAMAIAFTTKNPNPRFRNTYGWFSNDFKIYGKSEFGDIYISMFKNTNNDYVSYTKTFTDNLEMMRRSDSQQVANTNMFASVEYFVNLVNIGRCVVSELPETLLFITDNENNSGKSPKEAVIYANSIGWKPKLIFWGITSMNHSIREELKYTPNSLFVGGFNEGCLSQILNGIDKETINPEDELWSIYNDVRYSMITTS